MCGRIYSDFTLEDIRRDIPIEFNTGVRPDYHYSSFNIPPRKNLACISRSRELVEIKWGIRLEKMEIINSKIEQFHLKRAFNRMEKCLVLISGFYEWDSQKRPFLLVGRKKVFVVAGLRINNDVVIMTTQAIKQIQFIHSRMPVRLETKVQIEKWLDMGSKEDFFGKFYKYEKINDTFSDFWEVTRKVGNILFNNPDCLLRIEDFDKKEGIQKYFGSKKTEKEQTGNEENKFLTGQKTSMKGGFKGGMELTRPLKKNEKDSDEKVDREKRGIISADILDYSDSMESFENRINEVLENECNMIESQNYELEKFESEKNESVKNESEKNVKWESLNRVEKWGNELMREIKNESDRNNQVKMSDYFSDKIEELKTLQNLQKSQFFGRQISSDQNIDICENFK